MQSKSTFRPLVIFQTTTIWAPKTKSSTICTCRIQSIHSTGCTANCRPSTQARLVDLPFRFFSLKKQLFFDHFYYCDANNYLFSSRTRFAMKYRESDRQLYVTKIFTSGKQSDPFWIKVLPVDSFDMVYTKNDPPTKNCLHQNQNTNVSTMMINLIQLFSFS